MPFIWDWIWEKLSGIGKITAQPQGLDETRVDNQVRKAKQPNRRKVSTGKSDKGSKSTGVRSNNKSQTPKKRTGAAVRAAAAKGKTKSKAVPKG